MERIYVFDTTLRDGEQSPGAAMTVDQKYEIALQLVRLGVDVIEAVFLCLPPAIPGCQLIAEKVKEVTVAALARTVDKDIDQQRNRLQRQNIHESTLHLYLPYPHAYKLKKTRKRC